MGRGDKILKIRKQIKIDTLKWRRKRYEMGKITRDADNNISFRTPSHKKGGFWKEKYPKTNYIKNKLTNSFVLCVDEDNDRIIQKWILH